MRVYCDGVFDLFHAGHVETLKYISEMEIYDENGDNANVQVVVGVINDADATGYKRKPIIGEDARYMMLESCRYVDEVIRDSPLILTEEFMINNRIDLVVHGFSSPQDSQNQGEFFKVPTEMGKFQEIKYSTLESTSDIIKRIIKRFGDQSNERYC